MSYKESIKPKRLTRNQSFLYTGICFVVLCISLFGSKITFELSDSGLSELEWIFGINGVGSFPFVILSVVHALYYRHDVDTVNNKELIMITITNLFNILKEVTFSAFSLIMSVKILTIVVNVEIVLLPWAFMLIYKQKVTKGIIVSTIVALSGLLVCIIPGMGSDKYGALNALSILTLIFKLLADICEKYLADKTNLKGVTVTVHNNILQSSIFVFISAIAVVIDKFDINKTDALFWVGAIITSVSLFTYVLVYNYMVLLGARIDILACVMALSTPVSIILETIVLKTEWSYLYIIGAVLCMVPFAYMSEIAGSNDDNDKSIPVSEYHAIDL